MHTIAAIAVALAEADTEEFILYAKQIIKNAAHLAEKLMEYGFDLVLPDYVRTKVMNVDNGQDHLLSFHTVGW